VDNILDLRDYNSLELAVQLETLALQAWALLGTKEAALNLLEKSQKYADIHGETWIDAIKMNIERVKEGLNPIGNKNEDWTFLGVVQL